MITILLGLCILLPICSKILPGICVNIWLKLKGKIKEISDLRLEIKDLKQHQSEISMVDEFAKHAKLGRKITTKTKALKSLQSNQAWMRMKAYWISRVAVYVLSFLLIWFYKYEPVLFFDIEDYLENPIVNIFAYVLSFPSGIPGAIGMPIAIFVCNRLVNQILNVVLPDKSKQELVHDPVE